MFLPRFLFFSVPVVILQMENEDDRQFVAELYQKYKFKMFRISLRMVRNAHDAEDLVEEACGKIIDNLEKIRNVEVCKQRQYIVSIIKNVTVNFLIRRDRRSKYSFYAEEEVIARMACIDGELDDGLIRRDEINAVKCALRKLSEKDRTILRMKYYDELTDAEIARYLNIQTASVRYYFTLARRKLGKEIVELNGE